MTAVYPGAVKSFVAKVVDDVDTVHAAHINDLRDEVVAVESELGTGLKSSTWTGAWANTASWGTLSLRLTNIERGIVTTSDVHPQYVKKAGDSMTGALDMGGTKITGLANGSASSDALAYGQVLASGTTLITGLFSATNPVMNGTAAVGSSAQPSRSDHVHPSDTAKVSRDGSLAMTGALAMGGYKITGAGVATNDYDVVVKGQLDAVSAVASAALPKAGGTMSGNIAMGGNYILNIGTSGAANDAATVGQVNARLSLSGGTMSGAIAMGSNKITGLQAGTATGDAMARQQVQTGTVPPFTSLYTTISFSPSFASAPVVVATPTTDTSASIPSFWVTDVSASSARIWNGTAGAEAMGFNWIAVGN